MGNKPGKLGGELLVLLLPHCGLAPEQVDLTAGWEESLVLLPLEGLAQQGCNIALINKFNNLKEFLLYPDTEDKNS